MTDSRRSLADQLPQAIETLARCVAEADTAYGPHPFLFDTMTLGDAKAVLVTLRDAAAAILASPSQDAQDLRADNAILRRLLTGRAGFWGTEAEKALADELAALQERSEHLRQRLGALVNRCNDESSPYPDDVNWSRGFGCAMTMALGWIQDALTGVAAPPQDKQTKALSSSPVRTSALHAEDSGSNHDGVTRCTPGHGHFMRYGDTRCECGEQQIFQKVAAPSPQWQPIDERAKDGTYRLVGGIGWYKPTLGRWKDGRWQDEKGDYFYEDEQPDLYFDFPPLPPPPTEALCQDSNSATRVSHD